MRTRTPNQIGSATMIVTLGVVMVAVITVGAAAFYMVSNKKAPTAAPGIAAPSSPYDSLAEGDSNVQLKSNVLNVDSGLKQEDLHLKGVSAAVEDVPYIIADD